MGRLVGLCSSLAMLATVSSFGFSVHRRQARWLFVAGFGVTELLAVLGGYTTPLWEVTGLLLGWVVSYLSIGSALAFSWAKHNNLPVRAHVCKATGPRR